MSKLLWFKIFSITFLKSTVIGREDDSCHHIINYSGM